MLFNKLENIKLLNIYKVKITFITFEYYALPE